MQTSQNITINKPIADVWRIAAEEFHKAGEWMSAVPHSYPKEEQSSTGAPVAGRTCEIQNKPDGLLAQEVITSYDAASHTMTFEVTPENAPAMMPLIKNTVVLTLKSLGPEQTDVNWQSTPELKPMGKIFAPLLKIGLQKMFGNILEELKYFAETGERHPRKITSDVKFGVTRG